MTNKLIWLKLSDRCGKTFCQLSLSYQKFAQSIYTFNIEMRHNKVQKRNKNGIFSSISIAAKLFGSKTS